MNKGFRFLAIIPFFGALIMMGALYAKCFAKNENIQKIAIRFTLIGFIGAIIFLLAFFLVLFFHFVLSLLTATQAYLIGFFVGGYALNVFALILTNKMGHEQKG